MACEVLVTTGLCIVAGEITTTLLRGRAASSPASVIDDIGYTDAAYGFDADTCGVINVIQSQSPDIAMGVDTGGAGDQGLMFGYACDETAGADAAADHAGAQAGAAAERGAPRRACWITCGPTASRQVTVEYVDGKPVRIDAVVISTQHSDDVSTEQLRAEIKKHIIDPVVPAGHGGCADQVPHQPDRPLRGRRAARRHRPDRAQDHRGHLRRHGPSRRRRVLRQGPDQGGPLGLLHGALHRQEHRGRRPGARAARCSWPTPSAWPSRSR